MCKNLNELFELCVKFKYDKTNAKSEIAKILKKGVKVYPKEFQTLIAQKPQNLKRHDLAFLAGLIELLCLNYEIEIPDWINDEDCFLSKPFVSYKGYTDEVPEKLKSVTNPVFLKRNYFTNENIRLV